MNGSRNDGTPLVQEETGGKTGVRICANASHRDFSCLAENRFELCRIV